MSTYTPVRYRRRLVVDDRNNGVGGTIRSLTRDDNTKWHPHIDVDGVVRCDCPDARYRNGGSYNGLCKHGLRLMGVLERRAERAAATPVTAPVTAPVTTRVLVGKRGRLETTLTDSEAVEICATLTGMAGELAEKARRGVLSREQLWWLHKLATDCQKRMSDDPRNP